MTKGGGKSRIHFLVMQNLLTRLDSSHFSSRVITRSIPKRNSLIIIRSASALKAFIGIGPGSVDSR